ncbi:MAG: FadD3 family acyl-CoA ligase [Acidimicrobiales bacterium]
MRAPDNVAALLAEAVRGQGGRPAVVDQGRMLTYADLGNQVERACAAVVGAGVSPGDRIAVWAPNSIEWIVAMLGLVCAGGVLVPINTRYKAGEAAEVLNRSRARLLFTVEDFLGRDYRSELGGEELPFLERTVAFCDWDSFLDEGKGLVDRARERASSLGAEDQLDLMFTSGTTGRPKGVPSRHGPAVRAYRHYAATLGIRPGDRYLLVNPLFHSFGAKAGVLAALCAGATLYPVPVFDASGAAELIRREAITVFPGPPTVYHALLALPDADRRGLRSLRLAVTGAATVPVELVRQMREVLGFDTVVTAYGLTEAGGLVTMCEPADDLGRIASTSGKAIPGLEVAVVGADGEPVGAGEPGEVVVRGYAVMDGYFEDPEATAETIDSEGWLHTGDIGVLDEENYLRITDRKKDLFIVGGFNVSPAEVEQMLMRHDSVAQAAVVGVPDERLGEVAHAFVVRRSGAAVDPEELIAWSRARLANFKVPRQVTVVAELPVNASGKVQRFVLRQRVLEDAP